MAAEWAAPLTGGRGTYRDYVRMLFGSNVTTLKETGSTTCHMNSGQPRPHIRPTDISFGQIVCLKKVLMEAGWGDGYVQCGLKREASQPQGLDANSAS